ncbi:MAG: guanylate kinase [Coriobacteriia bacterium]
MRRGNLIIVSGPSGAGKGTLVKGLVARVPDVWVSVSATTRTPRPGEREGVDYFFLTPQEFEKRVASGEFLEHATVHGNRYGTLRGPVTRRMNSGMQVVLEIDVQGAEQVKAAMPEAVLVGIVPPDQEELRRRIVGRGSESPAEIALRMKAAEKEIPLVEKYDYVIVNDDVSRATDELVGIVESLAEGKAEQPR